MPTPTTIIISRDAVWPDHSASASNPNPTVRARTIIASQLLNVASNAGTGGTGGGTGGVGDTAGGAAWIHAVG